MAYRIPTQLTGEPDCTFADTTRISEVLGWAPEFSFDDGVRSMLKHIDYWRDAPVWNPESIAMATTEWFTYLDGGFKRSSQ
jgi:UDP-glucose 4-epimerase